MHILSLPYYVTRGNKVFTWEEQKRISEGTALLIDNTKGTRLAVGCLRWFTVRIDRCTAVEKKKKNLYSGKYCRLIEARVKHIDLFIFLKDDNV